MSDEDGIVGPGGCPPQPPDGGEQSPSASPQGEQDRRDGRTCHPSVSGPPSSRRNAATGEPPNFHGAEAASVGHCGESPERGSRWQTAPPILSDPNGKAVAWLERFLAARREADQTRVDREFRALTSPERWNQRLVPLIKWKGDR